MEVEENALKTEATEDDDAWLYGGPGTTDDQSANVEAVTDSADDVISQSKLSADAAVFEPRLERTTSVNSASAGETEEIIGAVEETLKVQEEPGGEGGEVPVEAVENDGNNEEEAEDDESEDDDDIQVTIGDIKTSYDPNAAKFKSPYQRSTSQAAGGATAGTKTATKGVDMDSVGSINNVPVYEFDIDSLKVEDKPWRKPGADITDYFNYGFNEDTWTKYCERQRRLRMENNVTKPQTGNVIFVQGSMPRQDRPQSADTPTLGNSSVFDIQQRGGGPSPQHSKMSTAIDVIGSSVPVRDSRRQQQNDFRDHDQSQQDFHQHQQHISSVTSIISVPMSMPPPPHMVMPPPDFAIPPPGTLPPSHTNMPPPHHLGPPPPGMSGMLHPQMMVGPPPGYPPPPQMVRVPIDAFGRPMGPPPPERRPPPGFVERPPFGFDPFGRPMFPAPSGVPPPPMWEPRPGDNFVGGPPPGSGISVIGGGIGGGGGGGNMMNSPFRYDSDFSSSDDERDPKPRIKMEPLDSVMNRDRERDEYRPSRIREVRRSKEGIDRRDVPDRRDYDRERDRDRSVADRERERSVRERSRERNQSRRRSRERDERQHSRRKDDDAESHRRSKTHKKSSSSSSIAKKIKDEPLSDNESRNSTDVK